MYEKYAPLQFLVYWYELRQGYVELFGPLTEMDPVDYAKATGAPRLTCVVDLGLWTVPGSW